MIKRISTFCEKFSVRFEGIDAEERKKKFALVQQLPWNFKKKRINDRENIPNAKERSKQNREQNEEKMKIALNGNVMVYPETYVNFSKRLLVHSDASRYLSLRFNIKKPTPATDKWIEIVIKMHPSVREYKRITATLQKKKTLVYGLESDTRVGGQLLHNSLTHLVCHLKSYGAIIHFESHTSYMMLEDDCVLDPPIQPSTKLTASSEKDSNVIQERSSDVDELKKQLAELQNQVTIMQHIQRVEPHHNTTKEEIMNENLRDAEQELLPRRNFFREK